MKKVNPAIIFILLCTSVPFLIYAIIGIFPNMVWRGFGVDSSGQIYIGREGEILVYLDQECVKKISIPKYKTYYFTVQDNDTILVADCVRRSAKSPRPAKLSSCSA